MESFGFIRVISPFRLIVFLLAQNKLQNLLNKRPHRFREFHNSKKIEFKEHSELPIGKYRLDGEVWPRQSILLPEKDKTLFMTTSYSVGSADFWLIKTDADGDTLWTRVYGWWLEEIAHDVHQTEDGGYIVAGHTSTTPTEKSSVWLMKTDSQGDTLWTRIYGGDDWDKGFSVQQTTDGGYIVVGRTKSFGAGYYDAWLLKIDSNGDTLWTRTYGGSGREDAYSVEQTTDGGYIFAGRTYSYGAGDSDFYLVKTYANGDTMWTPTYGGGNGEGAFSAQQTDDGGYVISGYTFSFGAGGADTYLVKTDALGEVLWTRTYGGSADEFDQRIQQTTDGGYIIGGRTESFGAGMKDFYLVKTDANGDTLWTRAYGGPNYEFCFSVQQTDDGGYIALGYTGSFGAGLSDWYLVRVAGQPVIEPVPTLSEWGMIILALLLLAAGSVAVIRRRMAVAGGAA